MQTNSLLCCTLACLFASLPALAADKRVPINVKTVRLQYFSADFRTALAGPDGRTWYQLDNDPTSRTRLELRAALEAEYRHPSPQISGATMALLEPDGRAWFYVSKGRELWGYDGKSWIEHWADVDTKFVGRCPTRGEFFDNLCNRFVGGKAWFRDERGIHVFDGKDWHYRAIGPTMSDGQNHPKASRLFQNLIVPQRFVVRMQKQMRMTFD